MDGKNKPLPSQLANFRDLVKACYRAGFKPLSKAMKEASRRWKLMKKSEKA